MSGRQEARRTTEAWPTHACCRARCFASRNGMSLSTCGSFGSPRTRSPMMFFMISSVPPARWMPGRGEPGVRPRAVVRRFVAEEHAAQAEDLRRGVGELGRQTRADELHRRALRAGDAALRDLRERAVAGEREQSSVDVRAARAPDGSRRRRTPSRRCSAVFFARRNSGVSEPPLPATDADREALVHQRRERDAPAVVDVADALVVRDPHVGEEHLVEAGGTVDLPERPDLDARVLHVDDEARDAAVLRRVGVGARDDQSPLREVRAGRPDLLAVEDPVAGR